MEILLNGGPREVPDESCAEDLLSLLDVSSRHVAVEINEELIPRSRLAETLLRPRDRVEIATLVGGG